MSTYDPMGNARAAVAILGQQGLGAWGNDAQIVQQQGLVSTTYSPTSVPINATNAAINSPNPSTTNTSGNTYEDASLTGVVGDVFQGEVDSILGYMINLIIRWVAGLAGIFAGAGLFMFGVWTVVGQTQAGAKVEGGVKSVGRTGLGVGVTAAGVATGQPELAAAGIGIGQSGIKSTATKYGQQRSMSRATSRQQANQQQAQQAQLNAMPYSSARPGWQLYQGAATPPPQPPYQQPRYWPPRWPAQPPPAPPVDQQLRSESASYGGPRQPSGWFG